jgi:preprotein translocase subunit SecA
MKNLFSQKSILNKYKNLINQINQLETNFNLLTDSDLRAKTFELKKKYQNQQNLDSILCESFAVIRESSLRTLGLRHFDVQLIGGLTLHNGKIAEMQTGEGKTLVATAPAYLNALTKKGVHIITVNDYLANRDQLTMGQIYRFLGLDTGLIQENMSIQQRQKNYDADITYVTNNEIGFDYLRDNMALNLTDVVLRPFNYCIVDEVDSILIDEAQTPLVLSDSIETPIDKYILAAEITQYLFVNIHFKVDQKNKNIILTQQGTRKIEELLGIKDLYDFTDPWIPYIINAIKAKTLFFLNTHYIIQNKQIIIVDEFTGRIMPDRRWSDGLHQSIEAKEQLPIRENSQTIASITYQNFFLLYPKLSGMTGTAKTAEIEFKKIYNLTVEEIPTARPNKRKDLSDLVYKDKLSKFNAIITECKNGYLNGQPILIGTKTVEQSETLAQLLQEYNLPYQLLNAKPENVRKESEIVAQAGKKKSITIATNMAGRGTDIILGGNIDFKVRKQLYNLLVFLKNQSKRRTRNFLFPITDFKFFVSQKSLSVLNSLLTNLKFLQLSDLAILPILNGNYALKISKNTYVCSIKFLINQSLYFEKKSHKIENTIVKNLGGLYIIGTERNDSRRIDNQLRGRAGRQGDPGLSRFFLSLDDKLLTLFGESKVQTFIRNQIFEDSDSPLESRLLTRSINSAQKRIEERDYDSRKYLFDYDEILNKQRIVVYNERRKILESISVRKKILAYGEQIISTVIKKLKNKTINIDECIEILENLFGTNLSLDLIKKFNEKYNAMELQIYLFQEFWLLYEIKALELEIHGIGLLQDLERRLLLQYIDNAWQEHLQKMSLLRDSVGWRGYGQRNPLFEYKTDAYKLFQNRNQVTRHLVIYEIFRTNIL